MMTNNFNNSKIYSLNSVILKNISKNFSGQWIFKNISFEAKSGDVVSITGYNGSGKSTLLQIIAGYISPTEGIIKYNINESKIKQENVYQIISYSAPYLDLIEDFSLNEIIHFYFSLKAKQRGSDLKKILEISQLSTSADKKLKYFSSGMKQRARLILSLLTEAPLLLLDEPASNMDRAGIDWFHSAFKEFSNNKIVFICSNSSIEETTLGNRILNVEDFK